MWSCAEGSGISLCAPLNFSQRLCVENQAAHSTLGRRISAHAPSTCSEHPLLSHTPKIPFAADTGSADKLPAMKLRQNQVWHLGGEFLRIVALERLEVSYKTMKNLATGEGKHVTATKKEFCRLIKNATLLTPEDESALRAESA